MIIDVGRSWRDDTSPTLTSVTMTDDTTIVSSYPGSGTADTVYVARSGKTYHVTCSTTLPPGLKWEGRRYRAESVTISVRSQPKSQVELEWEEAAARIAACRESRAKQIAKKGRGYFPRSVESTRVILRPEFHARSNPRGG